MADRLDSKIARETFEFYTEVDAKVGSTPKTAKRKVADDLEGDDAAE